MKKIKVSLLILSLFIILTSLFFIPSFADSSYLGGSEFNVFPKDLTVRYDDSLLESNLYFDQYVSEGLFYSPDGIFINYDSGYGFGSFSLYSYQVDYLYVSGSQVVRGLQITLSSRDGESLTFYEYNDEYLGMHSNSSGRYFLNDFSLVSTKYSVLDKDFYYALLFISDFDPLISGVLDFTTNRDYSVGVTNSFSFQGELIYNGNSYSGSLSFYSPYTTSNGDINRVVAYISSDSSPNRIFINPSLPFTVRVPSLSVREYPEFVLFASNSNASYLVDGGYYVSNDFQYVQGSFYDSFYPSINVSFTSNDQLFTSLSLASTPLGDSTRFTLLYGLPSGDFIEALTYTSSGGLFWDVNWSNNAYRRIDFGATPQFISSSDYSFITSLFSDAVDSDSIENAYNDGFNEGYDLGYSNGLNDGIAIGKQEASSDNFFADFFGNILGALDKLAIFGDVSVLDILVILVGFSFVLLILKLFAGG